MRMRMADGFEHFQLAGFNDGDGLRAGDGRKAFQGVNQILQGDTRAAHDFGIGVNDALQIFAGHNMAKIPLLAELSPANAVVVHAPAMPADDAGRRLEINTVGSAVTTLDP